jgi:hypothetical protein
MSLLFISLLTILFSYKKLIYSLVIFPFLGLISFLVIFLSFLLCFIFMFCLSSFLLFMFCLSLLATFISFFLLRIFTESVFCSFHSLRLNDILEDGTQVGRTNKKTIFSGKNRVSFLNFQEGT